MKEEQKEEMQQTPMDPSSQNFSQSDSKSSKGSKMKTIGVIFLFLSLFIMIMFLPQISSFIDSKKQHEEVIMASPKEEEYKMRSCALKKSTDDMINEITLEFYYQNNSLKKEFLTNQVSFLGENQDVDSLKLLFLSCQAFKEQIEQNDGITQNCSLKDNTYTITQNIDYSKIAEIQLQENIGELEGFYPEFSFNQDRMVIEKQLTESGYVCKSKN